MKVARNILLTLSATFVMCLSSCSFKEDLEVRPYPINEFIFNTFLFAQGSWWAFYDSTSGSYDTLYVTENYGQHQNVYEDTHFLYYRYYYRAYWLWSKTNKRFAVEYFSDRVSDRKGRKIARMDLTGYGNSYGFGYDKLFYENTLLHDTLFAGHAYFPGQDKISKFVLQEKGDSLYYQNKWTVAPYVKYTLIGSVACELKDVTFLFQSYTGLVAHNMDGNYHLVDQYLLPMLK